MKLSERFDALDRTRSPDLWPGIQHRQPRTAAPPAPGGRRIAAATLALLVAATAIGIVVRAFQHPSGQAVGILMAPVSSFGNGLIAYVQTDDSGRGPWDIVAVEPDGTGRLVLTTEPGGYGDPAWSPDGSNLSLTLMVGTASRIATLKPDGSSVQELTHCDPPECLSDTSPAWSPDGSRIAWARESGAGAIIPESIFVLDAHGGPTSAFGANGEPSVALPGLAYVGGLAWSPDGASIAFDASQAGPTKHFSIYVVDVKTGAITRLTNCPIPECQIGDLHPSWAPDGSRIVFARDGDLYVMDSDGTNVRRLYSCVPVCVGAMEPVWAPDGREIAFAVQTGEQRDLYVMTWDGSDVRRITDGPGDEFSPTWQAITTGEGTPQETTTDCVEGRTSGDFDGDGVPDSADFVEVVRGIVVCDNAGTVVQNLKAQEVVVHFGSGQTLDQQFHDCGGGLCADVFASIDLDGDGRDELAVEVGPGAAVRFVELYRVAHDGIRPLTIAAPGDPPYFAPGDARLGGNFDSIDVSPVRCAVASDGTRELVSIHAEATGNPFTNPWTIHRTALVLHGDTLEVTSTSDVTLPAQGWWTSGRMFENGCP
jgi:WD40-like Beta Propeller Repeat